MNPWEGRVLTGKNGALLLKALAEKADSQALLRTNSACGTEFNKFEPWMSNAPYRAIWSHLAGNHMLFPEVSQLQKMRAAFMNGGPLRNVNPENEMHEIDVRERAALDFRKKYQGYFHALENVSEDYRVRTDALVREIIPLTLEGPLEPRFDGEGLSSQFYRGGIFLLPARPSERSEFEDQLNLIHEMGHQAFNLILACDPVVAGDPVQPVYSIIRKTFRPGILGFHALVAVAYMVELLCRSRTIYEIGDRSWMAARFRSLVKDLELGIATVRGLSLTPTGREIIGEFEELAAYATRRKLVYAAG